MGTRNNLKKPPAWFTAIATSALVLVPLGLLGCYGEDAREDTEEPSVVLTPAQEAELVETIDQSKQLLDNNAAQDSLAVLERSIELNPNSFAAHNNLCVAYGMMAFRDKAVAECQRAIEIDPSIQLSKNNLKWVGSIQPAAATQ